MGASNENSAYAKIKWEVVEAGEGTFLKQGTPLPESVLTNIRKNKVALKGRSRAMQKPNVIGGQSRMCTQTGGLKASSVIIAEGTIKISAANITKKAGPSPASAIDKSAPQASQRVLKVRKPRKTRPSPQFGQRQRRPADNGETLTMDGPFA